MTQTPVGVEAQLAVINTQLAVTNTKLDVLIATRDDHEVRLRALEQAVESPEERRQRDLIISQLQQFKWVLLGAAVASGPSTFAIASQFPR